jgi:hypothetical protein
MNVRDTINRRDAERYLNDSMDNLYVLMAPSVDAGNPLDTGREAFEERWREAKPVVCQTYWSHPGIDNAIDLTVLIAGALLTLPTGGIPVLPMAAIIVKLGLHELCPRP